MYPSIITETDAAVGIITLNRTERHNALDERLIGELTTALLEMEADPAIQVIVLSAAGKSFCVGADIGWLRKAASHSFEENLRDARYFAHLLATLNELSKPTIARIQGPAYGAGIGLIAACDIALATYDAEFAFTEVRHGVVPSVISPYILAAIGPRYGRRYMLSAERFSAAEGYRIGLLHEIVPDEEQLDDAIGEIIDSLLRNSQGAQSECKALIHSVAARPIDESVIERTAQHGANLLLYGEGDKDIGTIADD
ncbi:enoyl-CoA hydratase-related protein [Propionivibrio limicola]|uniref:enoyl-CoA hydratase-related protein n=1 Tax=Propionivibrio limicola TaxID=167645 RepID=UPI001292ABA9|nr:enoyl-CoA hydratase-related protein [Propionivibrio limicola]